MNYIIDGAQLTAIADAIRVKTGKSDMITVDEMPDEISGISGGSGEGIFMFNNSIALSFGQIFENITAVAEEVN